MKSEVRTTRSVGAARSHAERWNEGRSTASSYGRLGLGGLVGGGVAVGFVLAVEGEAGLDLGFFEVTSESESFFGPGDGFGEVAEFGVGGGERVEISRVGPNA